MTPNKIGKDSIGKGRDSILTKEQAEDFEEWKREQLAEKQQRRIEEGRQKVRPVSELKGGPIPGELPPKNVNYEIKEKTRTARRKKP